MPKRRYAPALVCYLLIPVVLIVGTRLSFLIDPEWARGHADYAFGFWLLQMAQRGVQLATFGLVLGLWLAVCFLALRSRRRSLLWLALAAAGPFGFIAITMLQDHAPAAEDMYQQFIRKLKMYWRVPLEIAVFVSVWVLAFQAMVLKRDLMISYESFSTGTPVETIIARQNESSGMYAFSEGLEVFFFVVLIYLILPIIFNLVGRLFKARMLRPQPTGANHGS
jgi:hypothetical protein